MDRSMIAGRRSAVYDFKQRLCMEWFRIQVLSMVLVQANLTGCWFVVLVHSVVAFISGINICF